MRIITFVEDGFLSAERLRSVRFVIDAFSYRLFAIAQHIATLSNSFTSGPKRREELGNASLLCEASLPHFQPRGLRIRRFISG